MIVFETNSQFIKKEEEINIPDGSVLYSPKKTSLPNIIIEFPQYEITYNSFFRGDYTPRHTFISYRGIIIELTRNEEKEEFFLVLLNDLKKGRYQQKMANLITTKLKKSKIDYKPIINRKNIKAEYLLIENEVLKKEIVMLKKKISKFDTLAQEMIVINKK